MDPTNKVTESSLWNVDQNGVPDNAAKVKKGIEFVVKFFSTNPDECNTLLELIQATNLKDVGLKNDQLQRIEQICHDNILFKSTKVPSADPILKAAEEKKAKIFELRKSIQKSEEIISKAKESNKNIPDEIWRLDRSIEEQKNNKKNLSELSKEYKETSLKKTKTAISDWNKKHWILSFFGIPTFYKRRLNNTLKQYEKDVLTLKHNIEAFEKSIAQDERQKTSFLSQIDPKNNTIRSENASNQKALSSLQDMIGKDPAMLQTLPADVQNKIYAEVYKDLSIAQMIAQKDSLKTSDKYAGMTSDAHKSALIQKMNSTTYFNQDSKIDKTDDLMALIDYLGDKHLNNLEKLDLRYIHPLDSETIKEILKKTPRLKHLFTTAALDKNLLESIISIERLETLSFGQASFLDPPKAPIDSSDLEKLAKLKHLKNLTIKGLTCLDSGGITALSKIENLSNLSIDDCPNFNGEGLSILQNLEALNIENCPKITGNTLDDITRLPELASIEFNFCDNLDNVALKKIANPKMKNLSIHYSHGITDEGLSHLKRLHNLETLNLLGDIWKTQLTGLGLRYLTGLENLNSLSFSEGTSFNNDAFIHINNIRALKRLYFDSREGSGVTKEGLKNLTTQSNLTNVLIYLGGFSKTDLINLSNEIDLNEGLREALIKNVQDRNHYNMD